MSYSFKGKCNKYHFIGIKREGDVQQCDLCEKLLTTHTAFPYSLNRLLILLSRHSNAFALLKII